MSQTHEDEPNDARQVADPLILIIDEAPLISPGTDDETRAFINGLMHDLAAHARQNVTRRP